MLRLLGAGLIVCGAFAARECTVGALRAKQRLRAELACALEGMAEEITLCMTPMPLLLRKHRTGCSSLFFARICAGLDAGETLGESWRAAAARLNLPEEEREAVSEAAERLGGTSETVSAALRLCAAALRRSHEKAASALPEEVRLTTALSLGACAVLLVLLF